MTTTLTPDTTTLHQLDWDWQPACETRNCEHGNPAATQIFVPLKCPCPITFLCDGCANYWKNYLRDKTVQRLKCSECRVVARCRMGDWFRLEPLP